MDITHLDYRLLADVGGTNARFTLEDPFGQWVDTEVLRCADYPDFGTAIMAYLDKVARPMPDYAGVAIANPVCGDWVEMTNHHWQFSIEETRSRLGLKQLIVTNDFTALAMALPYLKEDEKIQIGGRQPDTKSVLGLLGAGTGLGVSGLIPADDRWVSLGSEGGHMSFAPNSPRERALLEVVSQQFAHVSAERLVSGQGLPLIYRSLCQIDGLQANLDLDGAGITKLALQEDDAYCMETLNLFSAMLGSMAGNIALMLGSLGGVYIGGGVAVNIGSGFNQALFRERFEAKGRFHNYLSKIPCYLITAKYPAFLGMSAILRDTLHEQNRQTALNRKVLAMREQLAPAERLVADFALTQPKDMMQQPVSVIAQRAGVSEPTVIRFCRSMGFQGLSDFKLQLASGATGAEALSFSQVHWDDGADELLFKTLDNGVQALAQQRNLSLAQALTRAVDALAVAPYVDILCEADCWPEAIEAERLLRLAGVWAGLRSKDLYQEWSLSQIRAGRASVNAGQAPVLMVISSSGEWSAKQQRAMEGHPALLGLCPNNTPLAAISTYHLELGQAVEVNTTQTPNTTATLMARQAYRVSCMAVIDAMALSLALRLEKQQGEAQTTLATKSH